MFYDNTGYLGARNFYAKKFCILYCWEFFRNLNRCYSLSNAFFCLSSYYHIIFLLQPIDVVAKIDWNWNVEPTLYTWNKSLLAMIYRSIYKLFDTPCTHNLICAHFCGSSTSLTMRNRGFSFHFSSTLICIC